MRHTLRYVLGGVLTCGLCWLLGIMGQIVSYAAERDDGPADAAIVLGAAVWEGAPSPVFAARLDHAIALYHLTTPATCYGGFSNQQRLNATSVLHRRP